jgi:nitrate reductase beta subunit
MAMEWKVAFPLHPEYRTCRWSGMCRRCRRSSRRRRRGKMGIDGEMPDVRSLRIPVRYLANLLTAATRSRSRSALERMLAMRAYMRAKTVDGVIDEGIAERVGLTAAQIEEMYQIMAIANYEDRFVIPTTHRERRGRLRAARLLRLHLRQRLRITMPGMALKSMRPELPDLSRCSSNFSRRCRRARPRPARPADQYSSQH